MAEAIVAFLLGVAVGAAVVLVLVSLRSERSGVVAGASAPAAGGPRPNVLTPSATSAPDAQPGQGSAGIGGLVRDVLKQPPHRVVSRTVRTTKIQIAGGQTNVLVDGTEYHDLGDIPEPMRDLIVDELRVAMSNVTEPAARAKLQKLLESAGAAPPTGADDQPSEPTRGPAA